MPEPTFSKIELSMLPVFGCSAEGILTCRDTVKLSLVLKLMLDEWGMVTLSFTPSKLSAAPGVTPLPCIMNW